MASKDIQPSFLNAIRKGGKQVTVFLTNGVKLQGKLSAFDNFCVALTRDGVTQLVYKHAVATVLPEGSLDLHDDPSFDSIGNV
jgi:host factor-I protein